MDCGERGRGHGRGQLVIVLAAAVPDEASLREDQHSPWHLVSAVDLTGAFFSEPIAFFGGVLMILMILFF